MNCRERKSRARSHGGLNPLVGDSYGAVDINSFPYLIKVVLCVDCFYQCFVVVCFWSDHPLVCAVRNFSIGKCIVSLELGKAGLDNCIARDKVQGFSFYYVVIIMLFKLS